MAAGGLLGLLLHAGDGVGEDGQGDAGGWQAELRQEGSAILYSVPWEEGQEPSKQAGCRCLLAPGQEVVERAGRLLLALALALAGCRAQVPFNPQLHGV